VRAQPLSAHPSRLATHTNLGSRGQTYDAQAPGSSPIFEPPSRAGPPATRLRTRLSDGDALRSPADNRLGAAPRSTAVFPTPLVLTSKHMLGS
jgi:hypothetical protein